MPYLLFYWLQAYRRNMDERFDRVMYQRDFRLTNNPYIMNVSDISNIIFVCMPSIISLPDHFCLVFLIEFHLWLQHANNSI